MISIASEHAALEELGSEQAVEEALQDFVVDLILRDEYRTHFLPRLFSCDKGTWQLVHELCEGLPETDQFFAEITEIVKKVVGSAPFELKVTYLDDPGAVDDYAFIVFHDSTLFWTSEFRTLRDP